MFRSVGQFFLHLFLLPGTFKIQKVLFKNLLSYILKIFSVRAANFYLKK